jgi:hypothetical protein
MTRHNHSRICAAIDRGGVIERKETNDDWTASAEPHVVTFESETESAYSMYVVPDAKMRHQDQPAEVLSIDNSDEVVQYFGHSD